MKKILVIILALLVFPVMTFAATTTGVMPVTAVILSAGVCEINFAGSISFGSVPPPITSPIDGAANIGVTCPTGTPYNIYLSTGGSGTYTQRQMDDGSGNKTNYNIFTDATYAVIWGDNTGGTSYMTGIGTSAQQIFPAFGRIPAQTTPPPGNYNDSITVTLEW